MSSAYKTLKQSDISVIPYVANKLNTYNSCSADDAGINGYVGKYLSRDFDQHTTHVDDESLVYFSIDNLFYQGYVSQSNQTASLSNINLQAVGALESYQYDKRQYNRSQDVKIISIPQLAYGEKITPKSFKLKSETSQYYLIDDGYGNVLDIINYSPTTLSDSDIYDSDFIDNYYQVSSSIGNILYSQGFVILTNNDYYCVVDGGPTVNEEYSDFILDIESAKYLYPLTYAQTDCNPIDYNTLTLVPIEGSSFPNFSIVSITGDEEQTLNGVMLLDEGDPLTNTPGVYETYFYVKSTACAKSNLGKITITILDCVISGGGIVIASPTPTPTNTTTPTITPTQTRTPSQTPTNTLTPSITPTGTKTPTPTTTNTPTQTRTPNPSATQTRTPTATPTNTPTNTPTPTLPSSGQFRTSIFQELVCTAGSTTLYWSGTLGTGTAFFTDPALTTPLTGAAYVAVNNPSGIQGHVDGSIFIVSDNIVLYKSTYYCNDYYFNARWVECYDCATLGQSGQVVVVAQNWFPSSTRILTSQQGAILIELDSLTPIAQTAPNFILDNGAIYPNCQSLPPGCETIIQ